MNTNERRFIGTQLTIALVALGVGVLFGPLQSLEHAHINLYPFLAPIINSYYQGLTLHGVLTALVFTTIFITGFHTFSIIKGLNSNLRWMNLAWAGLALIVVGLVMAGFAMLANQATVLYTFYPPMQASPIFYIGLTILVVGSWMIGWSQLKTLADWKKANPGKRTPIIAMGSAVNVLLWQLATLGIAAQMLILVIPWSLGLVPGTDAELNRVLFWFTGHPLVYFWLLPAYVSWYGMLPKQVGGKMFSDPLARMAFWGFLILSTPVGFHHQFADPGVPVAWKYVHMFLTGMVVIPSMMTAFTVIASLERAGRARGGKGLFGWIPALPWKDPSVTAQLLGGIAFFFGGIGGIINASGSLDLVVHNTTWIPGHFHTTVATAVTLSFMGITFWLIPHLTGKPLAAAKAALWSTWTWFVGVMIFATGMHWMGLLGAPRRVPLSTAVYSNPAWAVPEALTAIGGSIMFIGAILYFWSIIATVSGKVKSTVLVEVPIAESEVPSSKTPAWLDKWTTWIVLSLVLVLIGYAPMLIQYFSHLNLVSPGFRVW